LVLPRAIRPSTLKGCVGTLPQGYIRNVPLPRVPRGQSAKSCFDMPVTDPVTLGNGSRYIVHSQVHTIPDMPVTDPVTLGNGSRYIVHSQVHTIPDYYETPYVVPTYVSPRSIVESAAYAFSPAWHAIAINT
jgi:uncharacterized protein YlzI (FlbEa/FlbD family)